jgi:activator of HSP90 ATPase
VNRVSTRRHAIAAFATIAATSITRAQAQQPIPDQKPSPNQSRTSIHYEIDFQPSPQRLYAAILDQKQFAAFSGSSATIDPTPGGAFSLFGGLIVGRTIELVQNQRIVQAWRPTHWAPGVYSIVHFEFTARGVESTLIFDHTGFPAGDYDSLDWGWYNHYWNPRKKFLV